MFTADTGDFVRCCGICGLALDRADDPGSEDCGGDCLRCLAAAGDSDCVAALRRLEESKP